MTFRASHAVAAICGAALLVASATSQAQTKSATTPVSATGKGTVGGGLLGGEVVCLTMGAIGVEKGWPYLVFGGVGAAGGAVGGYFLDKNSVPNGSGSAEPSLFLLAGGMVLLIPTVVVSLNATAYRPPETEVHEPIKNEPVAEPPRPAGPPGGVQDSPAAPAGSSRAPRSPSQQRQARLARPEHMPMSFVDIYKGRIAMGVPAVELKPLYDQKELWQFGVQQGTQVKFPVFRAMF